MCPSRFCLISFFPAFSFAIIAQRNATNIPPLAPPQITMETPDWAKEMY